MVAHCSGARGGGGLGIWAALSPSVMQSGPDFQNAGDRGNPSTYGGVARPALNHGELVFFSGTLIPVLNSSNKMIFLLMSWLLGL